MQNYVNNLKKKIKTLNLFFNYSCFDLPSPKS